jgi:excisionase family DNA binding protein
MATITDERRLLSTREAADRLGVSVSTVRRCVAEGVLAPIRISRRGRFRFRPLDVEALLLPVHEQAVLDELRRDLNAREVHGLGPNDPYPSPVPSLPPPPARA